MQVPIYLRGTVPAYGAVSGGGTAYTYGNIVTLQGDCVMDVFVHESTHAFDFTNGDYGLSGSSAYLEALYEDACVPDEYAMTNNVECFAQDMVVFVYYLWNPNFLENVCMEYQIFYINKLTAPGVQAYKATVGESHPDLASCQPQPGCGLHVGLLLVVHSVPSVTCVNLNTLLCQAGAHLCHIQPQLHACVPCMK